MSASSTLPNEKVPSPFSPDNPRLQLVWDSTSLTTFSRCPRAYQYRQLEGWTTAKLDPALSFGLLFHKALELSIRRGKDLSLPDLISHIASLPDFSNLPPVDGSHSRLALVRAIVWYFDHYANDPLEVLVIDGKPAAELSFLFPLDFHSFSGDQFFLSGHLDLVGRFAGETFVIDHKTTATTISSSFFERFSPDIQMSLYTLAAQIIFSVPAQGVLINAVQTLAGGTRFMRGFAPRTPDQLQEFYQLVISLIRSAEVMAESNFFPMNQASCFNCRYRPVCARSPSVRQQWLEGEFTKSFWNPLEIR